MPSIPRKAKALYAEIPPELDRQLRERARENRRTVTAEVILALEAHVGAAAGPGKKPRKSSPGP